MWVCRFSLCSTRRWLSPHLCISPAKRFVEEAVVVRLNLLASTMGREGGCVGFVVTKICHRRLNHIVCFVFLPISVRRELLFPSCWLGIAAARLAR